MIHYVYLFLAGLLCFCLWLGWAGASVWLKDTGNVAYVNAATVVGTAISILSLGVTFYLAESVAGLKFKAKKKKRLPEIAIDIDKYSEALKLFLNDFPAAKNDLDESIALLKSGVLNISPYVPIGVRLALESLKVKIWLYQIFGAKCIANWIHVHICEIKGRISGYIADQEVENEP